MNVSEINMTQCGSTGRIMLDISEEAVRQGINAWSYSPHELTKNDPDIPLHSYYGTYFGRKFHNLFGRLTGLNGICSVFDTLQLVKMLSERKTDVIHLHNLHSYCINLPILFRYIKKEKIKVIWTLHDCWSFTGHCPHYDMIKCRRWKTGCGRCPQKRGYPQGLIDSSKLMYKLKKRWFCGVSDMTLVTPSKWLADQVKQSFLGCYPVKVINNGIDLSVFRRVESDFRKRHGISDEVKVVLGVSFGWNERKGLDVFIELAERLDSAAYRIVLVGTDAKTEELIPENIITVRRTDSQSELAAIYSAADVFVNPTREETFPTVNIESIACGTPVVTFATGGAPEIADHSCGRVVPRDDTDRLIGEIKSICGEKTPFDSACRKRAELFDRNSKFKEYVSMFTCGGND